MVDPDSAGSAGVAASLQALQAAIEAGSVEADEVQRAYVAGAADALESVAVRGWAVFEHPDSP